MNKKNTVRLSATDKGLLDIISSRFDLAEQILGNEPAIYFKFDLPPPSEIIEASPVIDHRQDVFSKMTTGKPKEV
jgi:hypothetical protein